MQVLDWLILIIFFLCLVGIVTWVVKPGKDNTSDYLLSARIFPESVMGIDLMYGATGLVWLTGIFTMPRGLKRIMNISVLLPYVQLNMNLPAF